jgi:HAD superfamily hydrolase (TIGR01549 family)
MPTAPYNWRVDSGRAIRAVLFDLDDTLFDHLSAARAALTVVHTQHPCFRDRPFADLERLHAEHLEALHQVVLSGAMGIDAARIERFRRIFLAAGVTAAPLVLEATAVAYRRAYLESRRPVDGARALLTALKPHVRIGIVSNNLLDEQQDKIRLCELTPFIDALVVSEEAGTSKPDPTIFHLALERVGCSAEDAVMIGDSWTADVEGARAAGIPAIWFNPAGHRCPDPSAIVGELRALVPVDRALNTIFGERQPPSHVAASEHGERATRSERAGEAARESACGGVRGAKPVG